MLAHPDRERRQLADLVPLHRGRVHPLVRGEDMRAGPAALRPMLDNLVHPRKRKQRPVGAFMPGLAAPLATGTRPAWSRRCRRRILRGRQRRVPRTPLQPPLELGHPGLQPPVRLHQHAQPQQQRDRPLPITLEDRLRPGRSIPPNFGATQRVPAQGLNAYQNMSICRQFKRRERRDSNRDLRRDRHVPGKRRLATIDSRSLYS